MTGFGLLGDALHLDLRVAGRDGDQPKGSESDDETGIGVENRRVGVRPFAEHGVFAFGVGDEWAGQPRASNAVIYVLRESAEIGMIMVTLLPVVAVRRLVTGTLLGSSGISVMGFRNHLKTKVDQCR